MNTYDKSFYDLLSLAFGNSNGHSLQSFLDEVLANKYNTLDTSGFPWAAGMSPDFTYEQILRHIDITPMAQYTDLDSPAVPIGLRGAEGYTGKIPRMKLVEYYNEDKMRKIMLSSRRLNALANDGDAIRRAGLDSLFVTTDTLIGAHTNSLTYQRHQMVSTAGLEINDINNPNGIPFKVSAHVPEDNITKLSGTKRWWTVEDEGKYSTEGDNCDPIEDLTLMVDEAETLGVRAMHFEIEKSYARQIVKHSKVLEAIAAKLFASIDAEYITRVRYMGLDAALEALGEIVGAPFVVIDHISTVQKYNRQSNRLENIQLKAFEPGVIVLVPDGNIGEIVAVEPIIVGDPAATYATFYDGRLLLTVTYDASRKTQAFETELTALAVPDKPQYMFYLYPYTA